MPRKPKASSAQDGALGLSLRAGLIYLLGFAVETWHERPVIDGYISRYPHAVLRELVERKELFRTGRYRELMERSEASYLVLPLDRQAWAEAEGLRPLFRGARCCILARSGDPLIHSARPR